MILSILIPTLYKRAGMLAALLRRLQNQIDDCNANKMVEVLVEADSGQMSTGKKRNILIEKAKGKYIIGHDDDDLPPDYYIEELLKACESDADCFAISGLISFNGENEKRWFISKDLEYKALIDEGGREIYHRYTNHITAVKREIALQIKFPEITIGEDHKWATELHHSGLLKTEYKIERFPMYYYKFVSIKRVK